MRSGPLVAWANAFFAGRVSLDQAVDAATGRDLPHHVLGLPDAGNGPDQPAQLRDALVAWRRSGASVRLVLPVPGDVRGLPGAGPFSAAALVAGEAVLGADLGLVPTVVQHRPSSAPPTVRWTAFVLAVPTITTPRPRDDSVEEAQYELTTAIRESASVLASADVAARNIDVSDPLARARRAGERLDLPPGFPQRAVSLLAQTERLQAVVDLALADPHGGALDSAGVAARASALRPLATVVRRARVAGYNASTG